MTARFTSNPIFGGFGAPAPMPVSSVGAIQPGGTAGAFNQGSGISDIVAAINRQTTVLEGIARGHGAAAPHAVAGAASDVLSRTYNPARPPF